MIPYGRQFIDAADVTAVTRAVKSPWLTQGPAVKDFEAAVAKLVGAKYAVACVNGTAALHLAYLAAGLGVGDEVITTPNTFVATTNMLLTVGAKPVFCDIRLDTYNLDEKKIEKLITKKTKAIVPVHFAGQPVALKIIHHLAKKYKLLVIEDGAHALGAKYQDQSIGGLSDFTTFSFHPVKQITTGEGGMVLTNNEMFYKKMLLLRSHGITKDHNGFNVMTDLGYNYRLTDLQATLGLSQLKKLGRFLRARHQVVKWYQAALEDVPEIVLPQAMTDLYHGWHIYVIRTQRPEDRLPLYQRLQAKGIGVNFHYPAVYSQSYYRQHGFAKTALHNADLYHRTAITIPLYVKLKQTEVKKIATAIKQFFRDK